MRKTFTILSTLKNLKRVNILTAVLIHWRFFKAINFQFRYFELYSWENFNLNHNYTQAIKHSVMILIEKKIKPESLSPLFIKQNCKKFPSETFEKT